VIKKLLLFVIAGVIWTGSNAYSQSTVEDKDFKFSIFLTSDWAQTKVEKTSKNDAISYSYDNLDGNNALMILAFKVNGVKDLDDLIYNVEKDMNLDIPKREGDLNYDDYGSYERKKGMYQDSEFTETIYYFTTKNDGIQNYAYIVRFITVASAYNDNIAKKIDEIARSFKPL
jgi:hypothetical protein